MMNLFMFIDEFLPSRIIRSRSMMEELCDRLKFTNYFSFDVETTALPTRGRYDDVELLGIGFCINYDTFYVPVKHEVAFELLPLDYVIRMLKPYFEDPTKTKIAHNIKFDTHVLRKYGIKVNGTLIDTMIMAWLLNEETESKGLKNLIRKEFGINLVELSFFESVGFVNSPIREAARYCRMDAKSCFHLYQFYKNKLREEKLLAAFKLETDLLPIVIEMEEEGMLIGEEYMGQLGQKIKEQTKKVKEEILELLGHQINIDSSKQLSDLLFKRMGLTCNYTTAKGNPSVDEQALLSIVTEHPAIPKLLEYRRLQKLYSTYIEGFQKFIIDGKIKTTFDSIGTASGRFSSSNPNLQNIPRDDDEFKIRHLFKAPSGYKMIVADYSQIELRLISHFSQEPKLIQAFKNQRDIHAETALDLFGTLDDEKRFYAKTINFSIAYGAGPNKIRQVLASAGHDVFNIEEIEGILSQHRKKYPGFYKWRDEVVKSCREKGYVRTLIGRKRRLPMINSDDSYKRSRAERQAVNTIIQGSAADIMKLAMINIFNNEIFQKFGGKILSQIHDELVVIVKEDFVMEIMQLIENEMVNVKELSVPLEVEIGYGDNWGQAKK